MLPCMHSNLFYKWPYRNKWIYSEEHLPVTEEFSSHVSDEKKCKTKTTFTVLLEDRRGLENTRLTHDMLM